MSETLSTYIFRQSGGFGDGIFDQTNVDFPEVAPPGYMLQTGSIWQARRPKTEVTLDLQDAQIQPLFAKLVKDMMAASAKQGFPVSLSRGVFAKIVPYVRVPYFGGRPTAHPPLTMLIRVYFTVHIPLPDAPLPDADATISFYLLPHLGGIIAGLKRLPLQVTVDGAWVEVSGGWPIRDIIANVVGAQARDAITSLQNAVSTAAGLFSQAHPGGFSQIYLLPGNGNRQLPITVGDADVEATIALVP